MKFLLDRGRKCSDKRKCMRDRRKRKTRAQGSERNGDGDHRSLLIHPDYKVRLRLSDTGESCLSSSSSLCSFIGEPGLLLVMWPCLKLCVVIVKSEDLFIFYTQLLTAK